MMRRIIFINIFFLVVWLPPACASYIYEYRHISSYEWEWAVAGVELLEGINIFDIEDAELIVYKNNYTDDIDSVQINVDPDGDSVICTCFVGGDEVCEDSFDPARFTGEGVYYYDYGPELFAELRIEEYTSPVPDPEPIYAGWTVGDSWDEDGDGPGTSYGTILRSTDSGETWTRQGAGQIADVLLFGVFAVDPLRAWVVGNSDKGYGTIYYTADGGSTWERMGSSDSASPDYVPDVDLSKVRAVGDEVWIVGDGVILHSSNGGETWTNLIPDEYKNYHLQGVSTLDGHTVWAVTGTRGMDVSDNYGIILKTTDGGLSWTNYDVDFDDAPMLSAFLSISAADANTVWAAGGEGYDLVKTTDGGETWNLEFEPGDNFDMNEVYAVSTSTAWVATDNTIFWTTDGGKKWVSSTGLPGGLAIMGITAVSAQEAWASHAFRFGAIYHTSDGGNTWTITEQLDGKDLPGLWTISFATRPINLDEMINSLIEDVEQLVDDGFLNKGQGKALIVKLEHALDRLADDHLKAAINTLDAFSNQVDAFVQGGVLPSEIGQNLSDQVNDIIELL